MTAIKLLAAAALFVQVLQAKDQPQGPIQAKDQTQGQIQDKDQTQGQIQEKDQTQGQITVQAWGSGKNARSECIDKDAKCLEWATNQQCTDNPTWMLPNCMMSCGQCAAIGGDSDVVVDCIEWAKDGECDKNYTWMFFNCPKSCEHTGQRVAAWWSFRSLGM